MNTYTTKVLMFFLAVFILITVVSQTFFILDEPFVTETALPYSATDATVFDGVCLRDEKVITYIGSGVLSYNVDDGGKLSGGSEAAFIYGKEADIELNAEIDALKHRLELLKKIQNPGTIEAAQPKTVSTLIEGKYKEISAITARGELDKLDAAKEELLVLLSTMQRITGEANSFESAIARTEADILMLEAKKAAPSGSITVDEPGYFVSNSDGLEQEFKPELAETLTCEDIERLLASEEKTPANAVGKLVTSYKWKLAGVINNSMKNFSGGDRITLRVSGIAEEFTATIDEIRDTDDVYKSIIVISCTRLTGQLAKLRCPTVEMHKATYVGIRVPRTAIRFKDGVKGVYVKRGEEPVFRKISVIYESADYVISDELSESGCLEMYDDIILEGITADEG